MKIVLATGNRGKIKEIREILKGLDVVILTLDEFPHITLPPEDGLTFEENALKKARAVATNTGLTSLADDSGLEVIALGGRPGVFSSRYAGEDATDEENIRKLLDELKGVPPERRKASFRCALALVGPGGEEEVFDGALEGLIAERPSGEHGFGYDPVFFIPEKEKTAAELLPGEKNRISHRAKALKKLKERLSRKE